MSRSFKLPSINKQAQALTRRLVFGERGVDAGAFVYFEVAAAFEDP